MFRIFTREDCEITFCYFQIFQINQHFSLLRLNTEQFLFQNVKDLKSSHANQIDAFRKRFGPLEAFLLTDLF